MCCHHKCYRWSYPHSVSCPCGFDQNSQNCPSGEICNFRTYRCEPYTPTEGTTTRRYTRATARPTWEGYCKDDSDCGENEYCYRGRTGRNDHGYCYKRRDIEEEERQRRKKELEYGLLNIGLPVGVPLLLMPFFAYCGYKLKMWELRSRYGRPYRSPVGAPRNSQAAASGQAARTQVTEISIGMERLSPSTTELPAAQNISTVEAIEVIEPTDSREQTVAAVSNVTVIENSSRSDLLPDAPPAYNEIRRLQDGDEEQAPPSYQEAIENYHIVQL